MDIKRLIGSSLGDVTKVMESIHAYLERIDEKMDKIIDIMEDGKNQSVEFHNKHSDPRLDNYDSKMGRN